MKEIWKSTKDKTRNWKLKREQV